jgi:hypothetical protein
MRKINDPLLTNFSPYQFGVTRIIEVCGAQIEIMRRPREVVPQQGHVGPQLTCGLWRYKSSFREAPEATVKLR